MLFVLYLWLKKRKGARAEQRKTDRERKRASAQASQHHLQYLCTPGLELAEQSCHAEMRRCERRGCPLSDSSAPLLLSLSHLLFLFLAVAPSKCEEPTCSVYTCFVGSSFLRESSGKKHQREKTNHGGLRARHTPAGPKCFKLQGLSFAEYYTWDM
ncbi:hypothetical protein INR49_013347 [Caranx melampygus]|nr:hypothetical protein INR49_013347 [Caranx melampygus]